MYSLKSLETFCFMESSFGGLNFITLLLISIYHHLSKHLIAELRLPRKQQQEYDCTVCTLGVKLDIYIYILITVFEQVNGYILFISFSSFY